MQNKKIEKIIVAFVFILVPFLLFKDGFSASRILFGHDTITLDFPFRLFAQKMFQQYHDLPLWMPDLFAGIPLIDSTNLIYFYPTNLLYMMLPVPLYYSYVIDIIIHMLVAASGMYLLLRQLETSKEASLFGGFVFMTGAFMISHVYAGASGNTKAVSLMPYIFYFISRGIKEKKFFHFLNTSIFCALCVLGLGMQIMAYAYLEVFLYILYELFFAAKERDGEKIKKTAIFFVLSTGIIALFSALQFFQSLEYIPYSWRGIFTYDDFISWSFNPQETVTFLLPNFFGLRDQTYWGPLGFCLTTFYMGIIPLMLVPFAFAAGKYKRPAIFLAITGAIFFMLGCGGFTPLYRIFYYVPIFNKFRNPSRFLYIFDMFVIILAAFGINNILMVTGEQDYKTGFKGNMFFKIWAWTAATAGLILLIMVIFISNTAGVSNFIKNTFFYKKNTQPSDTFIMESMKLLRE